jgi:glucose/arabinose dehydrogenase
MRRASHLVLSACSLLLSVGASAFAAETPPRDPARLAVEFCAGCHGPNLTGGTAPNLLDGEWKHGSDDASILRAIAQGFPQTGMAAFAAVLTEHEQREMVAYLRRRARQFALGLVPVNAPPPAQVEFKSERHSFRLETVAGPLDTPWSIVFLPEDRIVVSDRVGVLRVIEKGTLRPDPVRNAPKPFVKQDGGYLDLIAHPDYAKNGWLYLAYTELGDDPKTSNTVIVRGRLRDHTWVDETTIFRAPQKYYYTDTSHYGCRFLFDAAGNLFFTLGERGNAIESQDLTSPLGKIHRVRDDGRPAPDNPFLDRSDAWPSIWTYGNRHVQGLQFDPVTGKLWATEHGPRGGDELNRIEPGRNYGWPIISEGQAQFRETIQGIEREGMERPIVSWSPSVAPAAIEFYRGDKFPRWKNHLFVAHLVSRQLRRVEIQGDKVVHQEIVFADQGRVRDVVTGPDGYLYVALNNPGRIARLVPID